MIIDYIVSIVGHNYVLIAVLVNLKYYNSCNIEPSPGIIECNIE